VDCYGASGVEYKRVLMDGMNWEIFFGEEQGFKRMEIYGAMVRSWASDI